MKRSGIGIRSLLLYVTAFVLIATLVLMISGAAHEAVDWVSDLLP